MRRVRHHQRSLTPFLFYTEAIKSIRGKLPQTVSADKTLTAGDDPIKLAHLLVETGVFPAVIKKP
jgi:hypothetical protein